MADKITSVRQFDDGSFEFGFEFDNGAGVLGETLIEVSAQDPPLKLSDAKEVVLPLAATKKALWLVALGQAQVIGPVVLS